MAGQSCALCTCSSGYSRHTFPDPKKNLALFTKWLALCKNHKLNKMDPSKIYPQATVCGRHFTEDDFIGKNPLRPILDSNAYPSLYIPNDEKLIIVPRPKRVDKSTQPSASQEEEKTCNVLNESIEADIKIEIDETIIQPPDTEYTLGELYYNWEALNGNEKPKNWIANWIDSGLLLAYFGDTLRHFSRSLLIFQDMTMEVRAEGKICGALVLTKVTSIQDLLKTLSVISNLFICVGLESDTPCKYGLVISLNEQSRCVSCAQKKMKIVQLSMVSKFRTPNTNK